MLDLIEPLRVTKNRFPDLLDGEGSTFDVNSIEKLRSQTDRCTPRWKHPKIQQTLIIFRTGTRFQQPAKSRVFGISDHFRKTDRCTPRWKP